MVVGWDGNLLLCCKFDFTGVESLALCGLKGLGDKMLGDIGSG